MGQSHSGHLLCWFSGCAGEGHWVLSLTTCFPPVGKFPSCSIAQPCLTLYDPMDRSPPDSSVPGILQARILEWVAMPSSRGSSQPRNRTHVSWISCTAGQFFTTEPLGKPTVSPTYHKIFISKPPLWVGSCKFCSLRCKMVSEEYV